ncbi:hypothetical protein JCM5296_006023 [Sporobolomyces johnsonii]
MRFTTVLSTLLALSLSLVKADPAPAIPAGATAVPHPTENEIKLAKRAICILGICLGSSSTNYQTDTSNCGSKGNVCSTSWTNGGGSQCVAGVCGASYCNSGYAFNWATLKCQNIATDPSNCGAIGTVCAVSGASTNACVSGTCVATACNSGYTLSSGVCSVKIDTTSDINNCGAIGNKCPTSYTNGNGAQCLASVCQPLSCSTGYAFDYSTSTCRNILTDSNNCGAIGQVCQFPHGYGACVSGVCTVSSCMTGYYNVAGVCTSLNLQTDVNNCGFVGNKCSFTLGAGTCSSGTCTYTSCNTGYALTSGVCKVVNLLTDASNCGTVGNVCLSSYRNGGAGTCVNGVCTTTCNSGYAFDYTYNFCRDVSSDINNCGAVGNVCNVAGALMSTCTSGVCAASACLSGYVLSNGACSVVNLLTDVNNCGFLGNACSFYPSGATGTCWAGLCIVTACPSQYTLFAGFCLKTGASQRARVKKSKIAQRTLCPVGESACPIAGSASYAGAVAHHFSSADEVSGAMAGKGGYECIDTTQALDSCGGCASTGEGQDCTRIRGAAGVGCAAGACVVFSCQAGWKPSLAGDKCVRTRSSQQSSNSTSSSSSGARRHLAAGRHGHHRDSV